MTPRVSVVIPVRDAEATIDATLQSLLNQGMSDFRAFVVDDHSTDRTFEIVASHAEDDPRIQLVRNRSAGVSSARNTGVAASAAPLVAFLDADDTVDSRWLQLLTEACDSGDNIALACCGATAIDPTGARTIELPRQLGGLYGPGRYLFLAGTFCVRRDLFDDAGRYDTELAAGENFELGLRLVRELRRRRLQHEVLDEVLLERHVDGQRRARRDAGRLANAECLLEKFSAELQPEPRERSNLHRIAAVNACRIGEWRLARHHARSAAIAYPGEFRTWAIVAATHGPVVRRRWERPTETHEVPSAFIVGSPRSGTTLLATLLEAHGQVAIPGESGFILRSLADGNRPTALLRLVNSWRADPRFDQWGLPMEVWETLALRRSYGRPTDLLSDAHRAFATSMGVRIVVDKTPQLVNFVKILMSAFPESLVIHLVRDGRAVTASWLDGDWGVDTAADAAHRWDLQNRRGAQAAPAQSYRCLRYEDLVQDPDAALEPIRRHLDLSNEPEVSHQRAAAARRDRMPRPEYHGNLALPPTPAIRDWRATLEVADVRVFERIAGRTLIQYGYKLDHTANPMAERLTRSRMLLGRARGRFTKWARG